MGLARNVGAVVAAGLILIVFDFPNLQRFLSTIFSILEAGFVVMLVFMVTKDDLDRYGIWKTFIGSKQPSLTQMLEFGKWAVFKPIGVLMQATIIDFNTDGDALESSETLEISSQYPETRPENGSTAVVPREPARVPPAPPPPPCPPIRNEMNDGNDEPRCKKLSWKELKIDLKNTVWEKVNLQLKSLNVIIEKDEVFELFKEKPRKSRKFSAQSPAVSKPEDKEPIGGKKQLNISIALAHHHLCADNLFNAVNNVDIRMLETDFLSSMESFLPDQNEESSLLQKFSSTKIDLGDEILTDPVKFSYLLSSVPDFRKKIRAMVFQCSFYDRVNAICNNLDVVRGAAKEIRQSQRLEVVLTYILSLGRIMNTSSAEAFNIDFLSSASCFKSSDGDTNFLMYLALKLTNNHADVLQLAEELPSLHQAVKVSLNDIDRDSTELAVEYGSIALELDSITEESQIFKEFLRQGKFDLNHLKRKRRQVQQELKELSMYLGVDPIKSKPMEIFSILKQFIKDLSTANENLCKKAMSRKNSSRAMMRSISAPNFKRSSRNSSFRGSRNSSAKSSRNSSARSSFRRVSRSISIASTASDVTTESQEGREADGILLNVQGSRASSKSSSPEMASFNLNRSIDTTFKVSSLSRSDRESTRNDDVTPKISRYFKSEFSERKKRKEPDLSKYRDLMHELKSEKGKTTSSSTNWRKRDLKESFSEKSMEYSWKQEQLKKILLSPVREKSDRKRISESEKGSTEPHEVHNSNKSHAGSGFADEMNVNDVMAKSNKQISIKNSHDDVARWARKERNSEVRRQSGQDEMIHSNDDLKSPLCDQIGNGWTSKINDREERIMKNQEPNLSQYRHLMKEREKELKTLHCRIKIEDGRKHHENKELESSDRKEKSGRGNFGYGNEEHGKTSLNQTCGNGFETISAQKIKYVASNLKEANGIGGGGDISGDVSGDVNGDLDEKQREISQRYEVVTNGVNDQLEFVANGRKKGKGEQDMEIRNVEEIHRNSNKEKQRSLKISKEKSKALKVALNNSTGPKNFIRGGTRNSFSKNRGSFRSSLRSDRGVKKVYMKATQTNDTQKSTESTKSDSSVSNMKVLRRRTRSEGVQAVVLKTGFIAKNLPMKLQLKTVDDDSQRRAVENEKTQDRGDDLVIKDKEGPILRRTKSAIINRNVREAKLVFFL